MNQTFTKPKAELHIHLEGSLEPEMLLNLSQKNSVPIKYNTVAEIKNAYKFNNLQEFLDIYYQGVSVLQTEQDYYDLTYAYLTRAHNDNVTYSEMFFDPQIHIDKGIHLDVIFSGINRAMLQAKQDYGLISSLIPCFLRHLSEKSAIKTFEQLINYRDKFIGIGLDSTELGNPPSKFKQLFALAKQEQLKLVAHAGEEGPANYVWEALDILGVDRIDHGNAIRHDKQLIARIAKDNIGLTMCPLSNQSLQVVSNLKYHPALDLLNAGVKVTINSDDPAYFGGYINKNYQVLTESLNLDDTTIDRLVQNSFEVKFI